MEVWSASVAYARIVLPARKTSRRMAEDCDWKLWGMADSGNEGMVEADVYGNGNNLYRWAASHKDSRFENVRPCDIPQTPASVGRQHERGKEFVELQAFWDVLPAQCLNSNVDHCRENREASIGGNLGSASTTDDALLYGGLG